MTALIETLMDRYPSNASRQESAFVTDSYNVPRVKDMLARRSADKQASFFLPYLKPGMRLLDCGCGPGVITVGLAQRVAPAETIGFDLEPEPLATGRDLAAKRGLTTVHFEPGDISQLNFPDESFDAVFSHAVLYHLPDPGSALREIYRVLKPGGIVGLRNSDCRGDLIGPSDSLLDRGLALFAQAMRYIGDSTDFGSNQKKLLREVGFLNILASASYDCLGSAAEVRQDGTYYHDTLSDPSFEALCLEQHWSTELEISAIRAAFAQWSQNPDAFLAIARCEVVAWK